MSSLRYQHDDTNYFIIQPDAAEEKEENYSWTAPIYLTHLYKRQLSSQLPYETSWWKPLEKKKTVYVALVMCLHVGVDPPDIIRPSPCARMECWQNPLQIAQPKPAEVIGNALHQQYERMQQRARYKILTDPISETVSKACVQLRKNAKDDRVLLHYNGHGVPKPTANGEIWVFNRDFTQYIPMCVLDVNKWLQGPTMYVFDCSNAGLIVDTFKNICLQADPSLDVICFGACGRDDILPMNPELPADLFTSCLTTPIKIALRWYCMQNPDCLPPGITAESTDNIPGKTTDRRTPLGELNWIFTAVTDTIGWSLLPVAMFQRLFRQDNLIAGLSRNFLLAVRILKSYNCTPCSEPDFPEDTANHPMWKAWDMVCDYCVKQLPYILSSTSSQTNGQQQNPSSAPTPQDPTSAAGAPGAGKERREYVFSSFFSEQLKAFETFLTQIRTTGYQKPILLPIVLQVLLAQNHRPRALELLKQFLDVDVRAVMSAMSVGVFPYIARLLSTPSTATPDTLPPLLCIYAKIIALDPSFFSSLEMTKEVYISSFKEIMCSSSPPFSIIHKTLAAYVISRLLNHLPEVRAICAEDKLNFIPMCEQQLIETEYPLFHLWIVICLGSLWKSCDVARRAALRTTVLDQLFDMLRSPHEELRTATLCALGTFIQNSNLVKENSANYTRSYSSISSEHGKEASVKSVMKSDAQMDDTDQKIAYQIIRCKFDISEMVRKELAVSLAHFILENEKVFQAKWKQLVINFSEDSIAMTGNMSPFYRKGSESFCIVNGNDCDSHVMYVKRSQSHRENDMTVSMDAMGVDDAGAFHVGTPPGGSSRVKKASLAGLRTGTPGLENRKGDRPGSPATAGGTPTTLRKNPSMPMIAGGTSETTEFKDLWDTLISLVNDPSGSVSDIAKQVLKRISEANKGGHASDDKENSHPPRGILRSDSCTAPPTNSLIPHSSGQRKKGNSCDDPTSSSSRVQLVDVDEEPPANHGKHTVTFNQRQDETYYYHKENPAGYFCTGFVEEYSQLMLEPFHKWPFAKANVQLPASATLSPTEKESYYNMEKLKKFRNNARWRIKASKRKLDFSVNSELGHVLDSQEQFTFSTGSSVKNQLVSFQFEPYKNSILALSTNSLVSLDLDSKKQQLYYDENANLQPVSSPKTCDQKFLSFDIVNSHEKVLGLVGNSLGCFKFLNCNESITKVNEVSARDQRSDTLNSLPVEEKPGVLCSFRGFRVAPNQPLQRLVTSWNCWAGKLLAAATDQTFDLNLNAKAKNIVRVWDLETQKCEHEVTVFVPVTRCMQHLDYFERAPETNPFVHYFGLHNGSIQTIDMRQSEKNRILYREHNKPIAYLTNYKDHNMMSYAESVKLWDLRKPHSIATYRLPENHEQVALSHLSSVFATTYLKNNVYFADIARLDTGQVLSTFKIQPQSYSSFLSGSKPQLQDVQHVEFHPCKNLIGFVSQNGAVVVYKLVHASSQAD